MGHIKIENLVTSISLSCFNIIKWPWKIKSIKDYYYYYGYKINKTVFFVVTIFKQLARSQVLSNSWCQWTNRRRERKNVSSTINIIWKLAKSFRSKIKIHWMHLKCYFDLIFFLSKDWIELSNKMASDYYHS